MQTQKDNLPFCGLTLKLYSTGNKSPKMEYQASSNKAQFQCSLTKKFYSIFEISNWLSTPEVQTYVRSGYVIKWGSRTDQEERTQYSNGMIETVTCFMVKPFSKTGYSNFKPMAKPIQQINQGMESFDDELPNNEVKWSKESPTDYNPDMYEQELG